MEAATVFLLLIIGTFIIIYGSETRKKRYRARMKITERYGEIPDDQELDYEQIKIYWIEFGERIPKSERIDEVTWNDLDMTRVFERLNNTQSFVGEQVLFGELHHLQKAPDRLLKLEQDMVYYDTHETERKEMQYLLAALGKKEVNYYLPMFMNALELQEIPNRWLYRLMQVLLLLSVLPGLFTGNLFLFGLTGIIFLINVTIYSVKNSEYEVYLQSMDGIIKIIKTIKIIIEDQTGLYEQVPEEIKTSYAQLQYMTKKMTRLKDKSRSRYSLSGDAASLALMVQGAFLQDFITYDAIVKDLEGKQKELMELYEFLGRIDMSIATASFRKSLPYYCIPEFRAEKELVMEEVYHPLLVEPVSNSLHLERNCLITGSNASGKSTFLKAAAVNTILAQCIHTCTARKWSQPPTQVITSMAVRDDVVSGESYYIREIRYLKRIIDDIRKDRIAICVIDEILRGTNTVERIGASTAVLRYICRSNCLAMVATHDIELTRILADQYDMYHFCEQLSGKDIIFDYKIHTGASDTRNAIFLLESAGFPEQIIVDAKEACEKS